MKELLLDMKQAVQQAREEGKHELDVLALGHFHRRYDLLLVQGYLTNPPPPPKKVQGGRTKQNSARNLLDRHSAHKWQVLAFLTDFAVPFNNNQAERDLRMSHPCSKKSLVVFARTTESRSFVAFAGIFRPCANKADICSRLLNTLLLVILSSQLFEPPPE